MIDRVALPGRGCASPSCCDRERADPAVPVSRTSSTTSRNGSSCNPAFGPRRGRTGIKLLFTGGLRIATTLDPQTQGFAQTAVRSVLAYPSDPDGAMTVIDPRTGYVRAMVGGDDADYWTGHRRRVA